LTLIERELPAGVVLVDDPSATSVVLARGVPSTVNTAALDPALMYDMRNPELEDQAAGSRAACAGRHRADCFDQASEAGTSRIWNHGYPDQ
jgi:hypothetical protein